MSVNVCCVHSGDAMDRVIGMSHHTIFVFSCVCECVGVLVCVLCRFVWIYMCVCNLYVSVCR